MTLPKISEDEAESHFSGMNTTVAKMNKRVFDFYPLEDRVLLSGEGLEGLDGLQDADNELTDALLGENAPALLDDATPHGEAPTQPINADTGNDVPAPLDTPTFDPALPLEVVFIDEGVEDADTLLSDLRSGSDGTQWLIVALSSDQDGVDQITDTLSELSGVDAIHLISHGDGQGFTLGNMRLDIDSAASYAGDIASWGHAMDADADLLIYGCDLASTESGQDLIDILAIVCDCDVAASDDKTGHEDLDGDWILEYTVGDVDTNVAFGYVAQASWRGTLDITSNLVAHYEFEDGSGSTAADSVGSNDAALFNGATFSTSGQINNALDVSSDSSGTAVATITGDPVLDLGGGDFSVAFWFNADNLTGTSTLFSQVTGGGDGHEFYLETNGDLVWEINGGASNQTVTLAGFSAGTWNHVTATKTGSNLSLYSNAGTNNASNPVGNIDTSDDIHLGSTGGGFGDFNGRIDEVRFYSRALTSADATELRSYTGPTAVNDSVTASSGGTTFNVLTNDNVPSGGTLSVIDYTTPTSGTLVDNGSGSFTYTPDGPPGNDSFEYWVDDGLTSLNHFYGLNGDGIDSMGGNDASTINGTTTIQGGFGEALYFNETSDYVRIPDFAYTNEFTVSFDFKIDENVGSGFQYLYSQGSLGQQNSLNVFFFEESNGIHANKLRTSFKDGNDTSNSIEDINIAGIIGDGQWHTYTLTVGASRTRAYLDGVLKDSGTGRGGDSFNPTTDLYLGARSDLGADRYYGGGLDSVRIYDQELDSSQVAAIGNQESHSATVSIAYEDADDALVTQTTDGGLSINNTGNDTYLLVDDGSTILGGRTTLSLEIDAAINDTASPHLFDYAVAGSTDELAASIDGNGDLHVVIGGTGYTFNSTVDSYQLDDGVRRTIGLTWDSGGDLSLYVDGVWQQTIGGTGDTLATGGTLVFGNDQDSVDGDYSTNQATSGTFYHARLFDHVRTSGQLEASYQSELPHNESGMLAQWNFDNLSHEGVVTESVAGNNIVVRHVSQSGFTADDPVLTLRIDELAPDGTVVGRVFGVDAERQAQIESLLLSNSNLYYNAESGKFHQHVLTTGTWSAAQSAAIGTTLSGQSGELVTIDSASENEFIFQIANANNTHTWLGASDSIVEGEWRWYDGSTADQQFWQGNGTGSSVGGLYTNWNGASQPHDTNADDDYAMLRSSDGDWGNRLSADEIDSYFVQWDADAVLDSTQALTYAIQSQTVAGAFSIDSSTGEITVASGILLDHETASTHTIDIEVTDAMSNSFVKTFTVVLNDQSEGPSLQVPDAQTVDEDTSLVFSVANANAVTVSYPSGSQNLPLQVELTVGDGTLTLSQTTGLTFVEGSNGAGSMIIHGTESDLNAALEGMTFTPDSNYSGAVSMNLVTSLGADLEGLYTFDGDATDQSAGTAQDGTLTNGATISNDAQRGDVLTLDGASSQYVDIGSEFGAPADVTLASWVKFTTADTFGSEVISLSDDIILRSYTGTPGLALHYFDGTAFQRVDANIAIDDGAWHHVAVTFDDTANTQNLFVDGQLVASTNDTNSIGYRSNFTHSRIGSHVDDTQTQFDFTGQIDDARIYTRALTATEIAALATDQTSSGESVAITVNSINDAPMFSALDNNPTFTEGGAVVVLDSDVDVSDAELDALNGGNGNYAGASLTLVRDGGANIEDVFSFNDGNGITYAGGNLSKNGQVIATFDTTSTVGELVVTFTSGVSEDPESADVDYILSQIAYSNTSNAPEASVQIGWTFDDGNTGSQGSGGNKTAIGSTTVDITAVNDAPVNTVPGTQTVAEETATGITGISIADVDAASSNVTTQLQVTAGVVNVTLSGSATISAGSNGSSDLTIQGSVADVNATLASLTYTGNTDVTGVNADTLTVTTNDLGNTGSGGAQSDVDNVQIDITAVNDAPIAANIEVGDLAYTENDGAVAITSTISFTDVDDTNIESAVVQITGNYNNTEDTLSFSNQNDISGSYNSGNGTWTLTGSATLAQYETAIRSITYTNSSDNPDTATRTVSFTVNDGDDNSNTLTRDITISSVNDDPTNAGSLPSDISVTEDLASNVDLSAIDLSDVDHGGGSLTIKLATSTGGNLTASAGTGITIGGNGTGAITLTGTQTDLNAYLNTASNVTYLHGTLHTNGDDADTINVKVNDNGNTGSGGGADQDLGTVNVDITAVNDAPVNTVPGTQTVAEETATGITGISIADVDAASSNVTTQLQVTAGVVNVTLSGSATISAGSNGSGDLTIQGSVADVNATLASLAYTGNTDVTGVNADTLTVTTNDLGNTGSGGAQSDVDNVQIDITAVNDAPIAANIEVGDLAYTENDGAVAITSAISFTDVDDTNIESAVVQITGNYNNTEDTLSFSNQNDISGSYNSGNGTWTLTGSATLAQYETAIRSITYTNSSDNPDTATRTVSFTVNDGDDNSNTLTRDITISSVNDDPTNAGSLPSDISVTEDLASNVDLSAVDFSDADANSSSLTVTLTTSTGGQLTGAAGTGITIGGTAAARTFTGSLTDLNNYFNNAANITYLHGTPHTNGDDADTINVKVNDNGNTGSGGGADQDLGTVNVDITAVNDAPVNTVPGTQTVAEETATGITGISIADVDAASSNVTTQLQVTAGVVNVTLSGSATISAGSNGSGDLTIQGSVADVNATLASLTYTGNTDVTGVNADTLTVTTNDLGNTGSGGAQSDADNIQIDITAVNDDPTNAGSLPSDISVTEDLASNVDLSAIDLSDVDHGGGSLTIKLATSTGGNLTASAGTGITIGGNGTGAITLTGTQTDLNAYLNTASNVTYLHGTLHTNGDDADTINVKVNDNGNTGSGGGADQDLGTVNVDITAVNDAPVNTVPGTQTVAEETATGITGISIADVDASSSNVTTQLQVTAGVVNVTLSGSATISAGSNGSGDLTIQGSVADVNATLASLTYTGNTDVTGVNADTLTVTTNDLGNTGSGGAQSDVDNVQIDITAVNDAPIADNIEVGDLAYTENDSAVAITSTISFTDVDDTNIESAVVQITGNYNNTEDTLSFSNQNDISGSYNSGNGTWTLTGSATLAQYETAIRSITYTNSSDNPDTATRTVSFTVNDGDDNSNTLTRDITISSVNDDPTNAGSLPSDISVTEDLASNVDLSAVDFSDADHGGGSLTIKLATSTGGNLTASAGTGITIGGNGTGAITLTGTQTDLNAYLNTASNVTYVHGTPHTNGDNSDTINVKVNDNGNTGSGGGADQDLGTVNVDITAVNDAPVNTVPGTQTVAEETATGITGISIADVDAASSNVTTQLQVTAGVVNVTLSGSATISAGSNGSGDLTIQGSVADVNATLASLTYTGNTDVTGVNADTLTVTTNDLGNTGSGGAQSDADNIQIDITAVNDDPTNAGSLPSDISVTEDLASNVDLSAIDLSDVDHGGGSLTIKLATSTGGNLTASAGTGITIGGNGTGAITLTGTQTDLNAYLNTASNVTYLHGTLHTNGDDADTINVKVNDNGNTGSGGGADQDLGTVNVDITAVNDAPVNTVPGTQTVAEETATGITGISIADVDASSSNVTTQLQVTAGVVNVTLSGSATISAGSNGSGDLTIQGSVADVNATLASLTYTGNTDVTGVNADTLTVTTNDLGNTGSGGAQSDVDNVQIDITAVNDAPIAANIEVGDLAYTENDGAVAITSTISFTDVDDTNIESAVVQITGNYNNTEDTLSFSNQNDISGSYNSGNGTWTLTGSATLAQYETAIRSITYTNSSDNPDTATRTVSFTVNDGDDNSNTLTRDITISSVNDDPTNAGSLPSDISVTEDLASNVDLSAIDLSDVDHGGGSLTIKLATSTGGNLTASAGTGITIGGNGTGAITLTGTQTDLNAYLNTASNVTYLHGTLHTNGDNADTINVKVNDNGNTGSGGGADQDLGTVNVDITAVNDAPVNTVPGTQTVAEETATGITSISIADVDAASSNVTTQLQVTAGVVNVTLSGSATISAGSNGSGDLTIQGSVADVNATLASLAYTGNTDVTGVNADTLTVTTNDLGNTGSGGAQSDVDNIQIDITAANDAPVADNIEVGDLAYTENDGAVAITSTISFTDVDDTNIESAVVQITGNYNNTEDTLSFSNQNDISGSYNSGNGTWTLTGSATLAQYETAIRSITYTNSSDNPDTATRTVSFTVNDGDDNSNTLTRDITISSVNDDPTNAGSLPSDISVTEDVAGNVDLSAVDFSDADANSSSLTVTLTTSTGGQLTGAAGTGITIGGTAAARTFTGSLTDLNNYLNNAANITYVHGTPHTNGDNADTINVKVNDNGNTGSGGGADQDLGTVNVDITAVNDAPVNTVPGTQTVAEETATGITGISIADVDASSSNVTTQLQVTAGVVNVTLSGSATISAGSNGSGDLTIQGSVADVNATLASLTYTGNTDVTGVNADTLTVTTNDLGNTGSGGAQSDADNIQIDITAVNDDPTNAGSLPSDISVTEDLASNVDLSAIDLSDVDHGGGSLTIKLATSTGGNLTASAGTGITIGGNGTGAITLTGTQTDLNAYLNTASNVTYVHGTLHTNGDDADTINVKVNDNGNTGSGGGADQDLGTVNVDITAVNDAPVNTVPGTQTVAEETATGITGISIADVDASSSNVTTQLQVTAGVVNVTLSGSATISAGSNGSGDLTIQGSVADVNATLASLTYTGNTDVTGVNADTLTVTTNDLGNTGSGGAQSDADNIQIDITAVNDDPTNAGSLPSDISVTEDLASNVDLSAIDLSDVDHGGGSLTIKLATSTGGNLTASAGTGITIGGNGTGAITLTGTQTDLNAYLNTASNVTYLHGTLHTNGDNSDTINVKVNDNGNTGSGGGADQDLGTVNVDITAVNDAPVNTVPGTQTVAEETATGITGISIADVDAASSNVTTQLQVTAGVVNVTLSGSATISAGSNGSGDLTIQGSVADVNATLASLAYTGNTDVTGVNADTLTVTTNDLGNTGSGGAQSDVDNVQIDITAANDAPVADNIEVGDLAYTENDGAVAITSTISFTDVDDTNIESAVVQITGNYNNTEDTLSFSNQNGISGSYNSGNGTWTLTGSATLAQYETAIRSITYTNSSDNPDTATRTVSFTVNDGDDNSNTLTRDITISSVNDDPTNAGSLPSDISVTEDVASNVDLSAVDFSDADANSSSLTVTLTTSTGGQLTGAAGTGITIGGTAAARTFTGSLTDLNNYFNNAANITYLHGTPHTNGDDADTINVKVNDNGNTGSGGGADQDLGTVNVDITAVNDAPVNTVPGTQTVAEETATGITGISIADVDAASSNVTTQLQVTAGVVNVTLSGSATISAGSNGSGDLTIQGSVADVNATLASLTYTGNTDVTGVNADTLTVTTNDLGNTGSGGAQSDADNIQIDITAVNDAPTLTNGSTVNLSGTNEDTTSGGSGVASIFVSAGGNDVDTGSLSGIAVTSVTGNGTWQFSTDGTNWTDFGSVSSTNALLLTSTTQVRYAPDGIDGETATFGFIGWDQTVSSGSTFGSPSIVDPTGAQGGTNEFSNESATASMVVTAMNDVVIAVADTGSATESGGVANATAGSDATGNVLTNDNDVDPGDSLNVTGVAAGTVGDATTNVGASVTGNYGSIVIASDGSYTYTINETLAAVEALRTSGDTLTETFTYKVEDTEGGADVTQVTITIHGTNDNPMAVVDTATAYEAGGVSNGTAGTDPTGNVLANDTDVDAGDTKTITGVAAGAQASAAGNVNFAVNGNYGSITIQANGSYLYNVDNNNATVQALRTSGQSVTDTFTYTFEDTDGLESTTQLTVTIRGANDDPVANFDTATAVEAGGVGNATAGTDPTGNVLSNDTDVDAGDSQTVTGNIVGSSTGAVGTSVAGSYGSITINSDGSYTYTVDNNNAAVEALGSSAETLDDVFTYTVTDAAGGTSSANLTVTIEGRNDAPIVTGPANATVAESGSLTFDAGGTGVIDTFDFDDDLTVTLTANHASITLAQTTGLTLIDGDGSDGTLQFSGTQANIDAALDGLDYDSQSGYNGSATLVILVDDGSLTDTHTVAITVSPGQTTFVWDGGGSTDDWTDAANWDHDLVPEADDIVVFNATSSKDSDINAAFAGSVSEIQVSAGYTGTITQRRDFQVTSDFTQSSGTFITAGHLLDIDGDLTRPGGTMSWSTSRVELAGNFDSTPSLGMGSSLLVLDGSGDQSYSRIGNLYSLEIDKSGGTLTFATNLDLFGDLTHTAGNVDFDGNRVSLNGTATQTVTAGGITVDDFRINNASGTISMASILDIDGNLTIDNASNISGQSLDVAGDVTINDTNWTGSSAIVLDGTAGQTVSGTNGYNVSHLNINKASGTATLDGGMNLRGSLLHTSGTVDATTLKLGVVGSNNGMIHGAIGPIDTLTINNNSGIRNFSGTLVVNDDLNLIGVGDINGGTIEARGDIALTDTSYTGSTAFAITGSTNQTITAASSTALLRDVTIFKSGGTLTFANDFRISESLTHVVGNVDTTGVTTEIRGATSVDAAGITFNNVRLDGSATTTLVDNLNIAGDLTFVDVVSVGGAFDIFVAGDVSSSDSGVAGSVEIVLNGTTDQAISGDDLTDGDVIINKAAGSVILGDDLVLDGTGQDVNVISGTLNLSGNALTTTGTVLIDGATLAGGGSITNDLHFQNIGVLALDIDSTSVFETLDVGGTLTLASERLRLDVGDVAVGGLVDDLVTYGTLAGTWDSVELTNNTAKSFTPFVEYNADSMNVFLNTPPTGTIADFSVNENAADTVIDLAAAFADEEHTDGQITYSIQGNTNSTLVDITLDNTGDTLTLDYAANLHGSSTITVRGTDPRGQYVDVVFTVTVNSINDAPVASDGTNTAIEDGATVGGTLVATDNDPGDTLTYSLVTNTSEGTVVVNSGGSYTFDPGSDFQDLAAGETRDVTFVYRVTDDGAGTLSDEATVTITVTGTNDGPVAQAGTNTATEDGAVVTGQLTETDADTTDTHTYALITNTSEGSTTVNGDGSYSFDPGSDFQDLAIGETRDVTFVYEVTDNNSATSQATVTITVSGTNDGPVAQAGTNTATEDGAVVTGQLTETDADTSDTHTYALITNTSEGSATVNGDGSYTFDPGSDFQDLADGETRDVTFVYEVQDNNGLTDQQTITITVTGTNDAPVATLDTATAVEAGGIANATPGVDPTGNVLANDTDADTTNTRTVTGVAADVQTSTTGSVGTGVTGLYGTITIGSDGSYTYVVDNDNTNVQALRTSADTLDDVFTYTITDNDGAVSTTQITVTIEGANDNAVATDDNGNAVEAGGLANATTGSDATGNVLTNDADPDTGDTQTVIGIAAGSQPAAVGNVNSGVVGAYGTITIDANGAYTYVVDNTNSAVEALRTSADTLTDVFTYTQEGTGGLDSTAEVTITISGQNDTPIAVTDTPTATEAGGVANASPGTDPTGNVLSNDTDPDNGDTQTVFGVAAGTQASATGSVNTSVTGTYGSITIAANGSYTYNVDNNNAAVQALRTSADTLDDVFTYTFIDTDGLQSTTQVTVTIQGSNDNPHDLIPSGMTIDENLGFGQAVGSVTTSDIDSGDSFTYALTDTAGGRFAIDSSGNVTVANSAGLDYENATSHSIEVEVTDIAGDTYREWIIVTLNDVDEFDVDTPIDVNGAANEVNENESGATVGITASAVDADGTNNTVTYYLSDDDGGNFVIDEFTGVVTTASFLDFESQNVHTIEVEARSSDGSTNFETFTINVLDVNEAPVAFGESYTLNAGTSLNLGNPGLVDNDVDTDGDTLSSIIETPPSHGTLTQLPDGSIVYTPDPGYFGPDSFTYRVTDGALQSNVATVMLTVEAVPVEPEPEPEPEPEEPELPDNGESSGSPDKEPNTTDTDNENFESGTGNQSVDTRGQSDFGGFDRNTVFIASSESGQTTAILVMGGFDFKADDFLDSYELVSQADAMAFAQSIDWTDWEEALEQEEESSFDFIVGSAGSAAGLFSIGYVLWAVRGGAFFTAVASSMPSWRIVDPTAILSASRGGVGGKNDDDDILG